MSCSTMQYSSRSSDGERREHGGHVWLTEWRFDHRPEADGWREAQLLLARPCADRSVDLLQVDVGDTVGVVADELQVVGAAVGDVPGVEAELHRLRVGRVEEALDLLLRADVAIRVGVEREHRVVLARDVPAELRHPVRERIPFVVGQRG